MQRWFFLDDKEKLDVEVNPPTSLRSKKSDTEQHPRQWKFNVVMNLDIYPNEAIALTGNCQSLGNWHAGHCVVLNREEGSNDWSVTVDIPRDREISYRYFVCAVEPTTENVIVRRWETHLKPRTIPVLGEIPESNDIFGDVNGVEKIDRGWLTSETIVQLKFFNAPFIWKQRVKKRTLYVKVTPMNLRIQGDNHHAAISPLEDSLSNDTKENGADTTAFAFSEVVNIKYDESVILPQSQFGTPCGDGDIVLFHATVADPDNTAYLVDLYAYSSRAEDGEPPNHLGYHYILPNSFKQSEGKLEVPITCATRHRPVGMMNLGYLIVKPFEAQPFKLDVSYQRYWNKKWTGLDVGHRGSGTSFKAKDCVIRENTISSLKNAADHGADMVEFDVQLSKDLVPVIYHDFNVYVSLKSKNQMEGNDFLQLPMRELSLEQLKKLKVYHTAEGKSREARNFHNDDIQESQPFPQLADVLHAIDPHVGFNIEIKWSQRMDDGSMEDEFEHVVDRNLYIDCILDVVMRNSSNRRIVFSCFDPDICTILRFKQNIYPVMFLTLGVTTRYRKYLDPRCNTIETAVCYARAMELLGIVAHTEDLLRDPTQVNLATNRGLVVFCWGDDNNSKETIQMLKSMGLHAIIYDKMDVLTTKEVKESVFLVQARESTSEFKMQCLEMAKRWPDEPQPAIMIDTNEKMLHLEKERQQIALSAATSLESLLEQSD